MKNLRDILEQKRSFPDVAARKQFGDDTKMQLLGKGIIPPEENPNRKVDTTGANSPFADPSVKSYNVTPDKPLVGSDDAVGKLLASKGYSRTGEKPNENSKRSFPDSPPVPNTMQNKLELMRIDSDNWFKNLNKKMDTPPQKSIPSSVSKLEPKVGSLVATQSGYPAAEKPKAPIPTPKPPQDVRVVSRGDTLWDIAGGDPKEVKRLKQLNPGLNPSKMPVGYKLKLK